MMSIIRIFLNAYVALVLIHVAISIPVEHSATCQSCHPVEPNKINIHIVAHSHDDVGWLKTVDQYYSGTSNHINGASVQEIISSSIQALIGHPDRRYIQVETAFFWKWWQDQTDELRKAVIKLVNDGQLEMINGAWSMNDEAAAHYQSVIDQFTWGFRILNDTIGRCARPKVGWQIDPFGHSREHASIMRQLGFQGLVLGRIDYRDKEQRRLEKNLDFLWKTSNNLDDSFIFGTILPEFYVSLDGFCFDSSCHLVTTINDDKSSYDYNLNYKVRSFEIILRRYKEYFHTNNIMVPMGGDFHFQKAEPHFSNIDKLINGFKNHSKFNLIYSTPSCYIKAVNQEVNRKEVLLRKKLDDFFPYASGSTGYWTGYFTSRPTSKRFERLGNNILQGAKQLATFSGISGSDIDESLVSLREAMGVMQHHDAITGTAKQHVANDYAKLLHSAIKKTETNFGRVIGNLLKHNQSVASDLNLSSCLLANVSICEISTKRHFVVTVYNPSSRISTHYVRLPIPESFMFIITGPDGEEEYDILDPISDFSYVKENLKPSEKELLFAARDLPPLGIKLYYVENILASTAARQRRLDKQDNWFKIDEHTGRLALLKLNGKVLNISQNFLYYRGGSGYMHKYSGAYIFWPASQEATPFTTEKVETTTKSGYLVDEVTQIYNSEVRQIIRIYKDPAEAYVEFDWLVGDLKTYNEGKEVISRFTFDSNFDNRGVFYTDSNGRELIKREVNKRSDYNYRSVVDSVTSNYYPVTSRIVVKDEEKDLQVAVLNDRAQGGSCLTKNTLELMVHRRLVVDDHLGVSEVLDEREYGMGLFARGQHYLTFGSIKSNSAFERTLAQKKLLAPLVLLADATVGPFDSLEKIKESFKFQFHGLATPLPDNVQILTLEPWRDGKYLLRLEHTMEKDDDVELSKPATVKLENLFSMFDIVEIAETTLGGNQWLKDYKDEEKLIWNGVKPGTSNDSNMKDPLKIELGPMQIRTFLIKVVAKY